MQIMKIVFLWLSVLWLHCSSPEQPTGLTVDLTRSWELADFEKFNLNEKADFQDHWKKNPNRYSRLNSGKKWQSVQMTFLSDSKLFRNTSKESITFTPNAKISWTLKSGKYLLLGDFGTLNPDTIKTTKLKIINDYKIVDEVKIDNTYQEKWTPYQVEVDIKEKLTLEWESEKGLLFFGNPRLIPVEKKNNSFNLILIVIDAMKRDALGCTNTISVTPNLDSLCKDSVVFKNHYSNANWTKPSMISFFYGEYASNLGIVNKGFNVHDYEKKVFYNSRFKGITNILREKGYFTESIMNNVFLLEYTGVGVDLGFHSIEQIGKENDDTEEITKQSLDFLSKRNQKEPFFLHVNYNTPHTPYLPPDEQLKKVNNILEISNKTIPNMTKKYLGEIHYTDSEIGKIIQKLKDTNQLENTIIAITSDHGDMFSPEHVFEKNGINGNLWGHGQTLYEDEIAIPLLIYLPKVIRDKLVHREWKHPSSNISLVPTLLGFLNFSGIYEGKGMDYSGYFLGKQKDISVEQRIFIEGRMMEAVIHSPYKYIRLLPGYTNTSLAGAIPSQEKWEEIYNIEQDPEEIHNLKTDPILLKKMRIEWEKEALTKNGFHLQIPPNDYSGSFFTNGEIYSIKVTGDLEYNYINRYNIKFNKKGTQPAEIIVYSTAPEWGFDWKLYQGGKLVPFKIGKWSLPSGLGLEKESYLLLSRDKPSLNQPLIYNDGLLTGQSSSEDNLNLGEEVRTILKGWGYIHE